MAFAIFAPYLRGRRLRWGASPAEVETRLPGDDLIPSPKWSWTHAIAIKASPADIWPWIAQIGRGRGGFHSYEMLENLVGCNIQNADHIIPELQDVRPGDPIKLHPKAPHSWSPA